MEDKLDLQLYSVTSTSREELLPPEKMDVLIRESFENMTRNAFHPIDSLKTYNPKLQELVNYAKGVEEKLQYLKRSVGMSPLEAELFMSKIPPEDREAGFDAVILRLLRDTNYFKEVEGVGICAALLNGLKNGKYGPYIIFLAPDTIFAKVLMPKYNSAQYHERFNVSFVKKNNLTKEEMWLMLATEGTLPKVVENLTHEIIHSEQFSSKRRIITWFSYFFPSVLSYTTYLKYGYWPAMATMYCLTRFVRKIRSGFNPDVMLRELHAYNAVANRPFVSEGGLKSKEEISQFVLDAYSFPDRQFYDACAAYEKIQTLRILGVGDKELGEIIERALFNETAGAFPLLEEKIGEMKGQWGIKDPNAFALVKAALLARQDLELKVERHKAEEIAARELRRETGSWFKN